MIGAKTRISRANIILLVKILQRFTDRSPQNAATRYDGDPNPTTAKAGNGLLICHYHTLSCFL